MARFATTCLLLSLISLASGCATCCAPYDCHYLYKGGAWVRHNPTSGRVGSAFDEAGGPAHEGEYIEGESTTSEGEPTPAEPEPIPVPVGTRSVMPQRRGQTYLP